MRAAADQRDLAELEPTGVRPRDGARRRAPAHGNGSCGAGVGSGSRRRRAPTSWLHPANAPSRAASPATSTGSRCRATSARSTRAVTTTRPRRSPTTTRLSCGWKPSRYGTAWARSAGPLTRSRGCRRCSGSSTAGRVPGRDAMRQPSRGLAAGARGASRRLWTTGLAVDRDRRELSGRAVVARAQSQRAGPPPAGRRGQPGAGLLVAPGPGELLVALGGVERRRPGRGVRRASTWNSAAARSNATATSPR